MYEVGQNILHVVSKAFEIGGKRLPYLTGSTQQFLKGKTRRIEERQAILSHQSFQFELLLGIRQILNLSHNGVTLLVEHTVQTTQQRKGQNHIFHLGIIIQITDNLLDVPYHIR